MERSPAITSHAMRCECVPSGYAHHARTYVGMRTRRHARRSHLIARASSVDGALERIVAWTALDVENKRTLNDGVPDAIQRDIDELVANGNVDGGISNAVRGDGVWEVCSAPHIRRLAGPVGVVFSPLRYVIDQGSIYSHVRHRGIVPDGWLSASGVVEEGEDMVCEGRIRPTCLIKFDRFWVGASAATKDEPREFPTEDASFLDVVIDKVGNLGFLDGIATFPVLFYDANEGVVVFQFPPLKSDICAIRRRHPTGRRPGHE